MVKWPGYGRGPAYGERVNNAYDVAVVGAGIVGLGHAAAAHARGLRTVVVERSPRARGATVRGSGHVGTTLQVDAHRALAARTRELFLSYAPRARFWLARRGTLAVATADDELEVLRGAGTGRILSGREVTDLAPVAGAIGGALYRDDMQLNPREMAPAFAAWLAAEGVDFRWRTTALGADPGSLATSRGDIRADNIVFCVGVDLESLWPDLAARHGVRRRATDMMLATGVGLEFPVITGSTMLRHEVFRETPAHADLLSRFERERPDIIDLGVGQTYAEVSGLGVLIGAAHRDEDDAWPFQEEVAFDVLSREARRLFGQKRLDVRQRWRAVAAAVPGDTLRARAGDGIHVSAAGGDSAMSMGLALGETVLADLYGP
nr:FAD-dependent oxidoreductase [Microbacterium sp. ZXX196]